LNRMISGLNTFDDLEKCFLIYSSCCCEALRCFIHRWSAPVHFTDEWNNAPKMFLIIICW